MCLRSTAPLVVYPDGEAIKDGESHGADAGLTVDAMKRGARSSGSSNRSDKLLAKQLALANSPAPKALPKAGPVAEKSSSSSTSSTKKRRKKEKKQRKKEKKQNKEDASTKRDSPPKATATPPEATPEAAATPPKAPTIGGPAVTWSVPALDMSAFKPRQGQKSSREAAGEAEEEDEKPILSSVDAD